jgi:hypothetical protein
MERIFFIVSQIYKTEKWRISPKFASVELKQILAEEVGFEPTVPEGTTVFKTAALDRSATPPLKTDYRDLNVENSL